MASRKMSLRPIDIQTQSQKKLFWIFRYFSLFFYNDFILSDQADQNMDRYGTLKPFRKWAYFPTLSKTGAEKNYFRFSILFFIFFNQLNINRSSGQKYG